ncbi:MAG: alcohol dehydrogenase catalytic domain-containing protein [Firmicutes bacterium]|nr:alcohol dehydrogenase catalytic domain-containing protein [Bacillota bacterium]
MTTMKAAVFEKAQLPWTIRDVEIPEPGSTDVLIKIRASGICGTDVHITRGHFPVSPPLIPGHEPVGEVVKTGSAVTHLRPGDRVGVPWHQRNCGRCEWCHRGKPQFCSSVQATGVTVNGGDAEYMVAPADRCMLLPDNITYEQAAPIFCAGFTVYSGLKIAHPAPGERIAVLGIGGLGHLGIQFAKALGFTTIAITGTEDKAPLARELGADDVVVAADDIGKTLMEHGGADVILATTNSGRHMSQAILGLRPDGRMVVMGVADSPIEVAAHDLLGMRRHLIGSSQNNREDLFEALQLVAQGKVKVMEEVYPFDRIHEAYRRVEEGKVRFRSVVTFE